jgi:hypothetical protein
MGMRTAILRGAALAMLACAPGAVAQSIPTPEEYFGFPVGANGKLISYIKETEYIRDIGNRSKWVAVEEMGKTTLGQSHLLVTISKPENLAEAAKYKEIAARLLDPRATKPNEAVQLAADGKIVVMITCGIHSDEVASPQMAAELIYEIAANRNLPFDRDALFEHLILLIVPSVNPDGQEMVADWVARTAGTENEGSPMPKLYHYIAGHDNNRDWFAFNLHETRNIANILFRAWRPQVLVDHHQMGSRGARMFVPPYGDPVNDAVHPLAWRGANLFGNAIAYELESAGKLGVAQDAYFQGWWQGGLSRAPWWHHGIGILTETASANLSFPLDVQTNELDAGGGLASITRPVTRHLSPWKGGPWRLRDICDYQKLATFAVLKLAVSRRQDILLNSYKMAADALAAATEDGRTAAWAFPADQHDPAARDRLLEMLRFGGAEVLQTTEPWQAGDRSYPAGSHVVSLAQPFGPYVNDLLEDQRYPDWPNAQRPYDITGWSLGRMMGVRCEKITFESGAAPKGTILKDALVSQFQLKHSEKGARYLAIDPRSNDAFGAAQRVIADQKMLRRASSAVTLEDGRLLPPGAFLVEAADVPKDGGWYFTNLAVHVAPVASVRDADVYRIHGTKIGIYESYDPSMDKGWTYQLIDRYIWHPQFVHHDELERVLPLVDAFILPESSPEVLWDGGPRSDPKLGRMAFPKEFRGGIGAAGIKQLRAFVERGGTIVALGTSCDFLIDKMELPVTNVLKGVKREEFACPGSLLQIAVAQNLPATYGMASRTAAFFSSNVAFKTTPPNLNFKRTVLASFPDAEPVLLSGMLKGAEKLLGMAAAVEIGLGKGKIVLLGIRAQHRAQTDATFKLLFNSVLESSAEK